MKPNATKVIKEFAQNMTISIERVWYRIAWENGHYVSIASVEEQNICEVFLLYLYLWPSGYYYCRRIRNSSFPRQTLECSIVPRKACEADHQLWHKIPNKWRQLASNWSRTISFQSAAINMAQVVGCSYHLDQSMIKLCFTKAIPSRSTSRRLWLSFGPPSMIKLWGQVCFTKATSTTHLTIPMINDNYNFPTIRRNWTNKCNAIETIIRTMLYTCVVRSQELLYSKLRYFKGSTA